MAALPRSQLVISQQYDGSLTTADDLWPKQQYNQPITQFAKQIIQTILCI